MNMLIIYLVDSWYPSAMAGLFGAAGHCKEGFSVGLGASAVCVSLQVHVRVETIIFRCSNSYAVVGFNSIHVSSWQPCSIFLLKFANWQIEPWATWL